jgi:hypothetical protein
VKVENNLEDNKLEDDNFSEEVDTILKKKYML